MIRSVLLIDDDRDIRVLGKFSLTKVGGYVAHLAESGAEGIAIAARERPDVIVLDLTMPGLDGLETLALLRAAVETRDIPVIFLTASSQERSFDLTGKGARGVLAKPFDPMKFPADVRRILGEVP